MILDTETNGFLCKRATAVSNMRGRMLQIAWALYTKGGTKLKENNHYIQMDGSGYQVGATDVHGITDDTLNRGIPFKEMLPMFINDLKQVKAVVGHCIYFDESVLCNELNVRGKPNTIDLFNEVAWICTQRLAHKMYGGKSMKQSELYNKVTGKVMENQHNALYDVLNLGEIVTTLLKQKAIKTNFEPMLPNTYEWQKKPRKDTVPPVPPVPPVIRRKKMSQPQPQPQPQPI